MCTGNPNKDIDHVDSSKSKTNNNNNTENNNLKDNESTTEEFVSYASFQPPDGGYGWVVVLGAFFVQFFVLGTMNNFGILFTELLEEFKETKQATGKKTNILMSSFISRRFLPMLFLILDNYQISILFYPRFTITIAQYFMLTLN